MYMFVICICSACRDQKSPSDPTEVGIKDSCDPLRECYG